MPPKQERNDDSYDGHSWTRYQQLVLNELQRHEDKLESLEKEITTLKLAHARFEMEMKAACDVLTKLGVEFKLSEATLTTKTANLNTEREKLSGDLSILKWKIGAIAAGAATIASAIFQAVIKYFLHT